MKKRKLVFLLFLCMIVFAGCAKENGNEESKDNKEQEVTVTPAPANDSGDALTEDEKEPEDALTEDDTNPEKIDINVGALKGPTSMGMIKVMEDAANKETANNYNFTIAGAADELSTGLAKGEIDIAAVPCNLASVLYNNTKGKIKLAGINTLGVLYIVETGNHINQVKDLKGKTIYSTGKGTTPQYTLNYLLTANGIDPEKDVNIEYKSEPAEVAALLSESEDAIAMLPQPYVTTVMMNNDKVRIALDVTKEWEAVSTDGSSVVTGVVVVRSEFLEKNKEAVDAFLKEYRSSTEFVNENAEEASLLIEKYGIFKAAVAEKAIPYSNITFLQGKEMKEKVSGYLTALYNQNPKSVGGALPAEDFYYMAEE
jgi:NitT/TauT family transport system substrate-binding protein